MPDKYHKQGCGRTCLRCWENKLKHGNPTKKFMKKHTITSIYNEMNKVYAELNDHNKLQII